MTIRGLTLVLALLAAPAALPAQQHPSPPRGDGAKSAHEGPVEMLLRRSERLGLSEAQVARLEEIGRRMEETNRPLVARLLEMRRGLRADFRHDPDEMDPAERAEYRRRLEAARPLMREIRENNRAAMREVGEVLTPPQKDEVRRMLRDRHDEKKGHGDERRRGGGAR